MSRPTLLRSPLRARSSSLRALSVTSSRLADHSEHHDHPADDATYNTRESMTDSLPLSSATILTPHLPLALHQQSIRVFFHSLSCNLAYSPLAAFFSPAWRNTLLILLLGTLSYPYLPSRSTASSSPSLSPETLSSTRTDTTQPLLTRLLARAIPDASLWSERNDRHLALTKEVAEERLLIQSAEKPKIRRLGIPRSFEAGSPRSVPVGPQTDMSSVERRY